MLKYPLKSILINLSKLNCLSNGLINNCKWNGKHHHLNN